MQRKLRISFCTVCMNRLHHLRETLPKNIADNISYSNIEFIVLDYNSKDGLKDWIMTEMSRYVQKGILKFYSTNEPNSFLRSHSKNVAGKQATGDIICNVDADNFIGEGFSDFINNIFGTQKNCYLAVNRKKSNPDFYGRICLWKQDFWKIHGYDESMVGYGFEDYDLWNRLELLGRKVIYIEDFKYLKSMKHNDEERIENESNSKDILKIYINYINHAESNFLYLFENNKFRLGRVIINGLYDSESIDNFFGKEIHEYYNSLWNNRWIHGEWEKVGHEIVLSDKENNSSKVFKIVGLSLIEKTEFRTPTEYVEIEMKSQMSELIMFYSQINNRIIMEKNKKMRQVVVNSDGFGIATLT